MKNQMFRDRGLARIQGWLALAAAVALAFEATAAASRSIPQSRRTTSPAYNFGIWSRRRVLQLWSEASMGSVSPT